MLDGADHAKKIRRKLTAALKVKIVLEALCEQAMAVDLAAHGIRVNAIAPGPTLTGLTRASLPTPKRGVRPRR